MPMIRIRLKCVVLLKNIRDWYKNYVGYPTSEPGRNVKFYKKGCGGNVGQSNTSSDADKPKKST